MNLKAKTLLHKGIPRIAVYIDKDPVLIMRIKTFEGARWSSSHNYWHIPDTEANRLFFQLPLVHTFLPSPENIAEIELFKLYLSSRRYSKNTITTYCDALKSFLTFFNVKAVKDITNDDVIIYNNEYILKNNLSISYQNQIVNAIKLYFKIINDSTIDIEKIHRPKRAQPLPNVLSKQEVKAILMAHSNLKHKTMLSLIYSCGLRCGELLALQPSHIDSKRNIVQLRNAKGKKDRIVPLSQKILAMLREYYLVYKPKVFLFEGQTEGNPYDARSLQQVLKQALKKTGITKPVTLHWLRHSYATHIA